MKKSFISKFLSLAHGLVLGVGALVGANRVQANAAMAEGTSVTLTSKNAATNGGVTVTPKKESGTDPLYRSDDAVLRMYANNTITVSSPSQKMSNISFECTKNPNKPFANITADVGFFTAAASDGDTAVWTGESNTVVFTIGTGQIQVATFDITFASSTDPIVVLSVSELELGVGNNTVVSATSFTNFSGTPTVAWTSSKADVVSITNAEGNSATLNGLKIGTAQVTCTATYGTEVASSTIDVVVNYAEPSVIENISLADLLDNTEGDGKRKFTTSGIIKGFGIDGTSSKDKYGNMVITDGTTDVVCYGCTGGDATSLTWNSTNGKYTFKNGENFLTLTATKTLVIGDRVNIECIRSDHQGAKQINAKIISTVINELTDIEVTPIKTEYQQGDTILPADFTVVGDYTVAGNKTIPSSNCTISPSVLNTYGDDIEVTISYGGKSDTYSVKVNELVIDITSLNIEQSSVTLLSTSETVQLNATVLPENHIERAVWSSSDNNVATVDENGLVTYVSEGSATITLKGEKNVYSDSCTVVCRKGAFFEQSNTYTDTITMGTTGVTSGTAYTEWDNVSKANESLGINSDAVYKGQSAANGGKSIQLRSSSSNSGIVTTTSGGNIKSLKIKYYSGNTRILIYGSNTAYSAATDLYSTSTQGTKIGELAPSTATTNELTCELDLSKGPYKYIGIRSNSGALYLTSVAVEWDCTTKTNATVTDLDALEEFTEDYLLMSIYDSELTGNGDGSCKDFWSEVKEAFNALTDNQRKFFVNCKDNAQYASAYARLVAWATANGDTLNTTNNILGSAKYTLTNSVSGDVAVLITVVSTIAASALLGYILISKKRKENY